MPKGAQVLCLSGREMAPTRQRPFIVFIWFQYDGGNITVSLCLIHNTLLKDTLGARNEDYVGGATC